MPSAVATPAGYNLTYSSDVYGNLTCVTNGQTNGPCPNWTFNLNTNQITTAGFSYDAAGNVLSDGTNSYQWDAEGRMISMNSGAPTAFNALRFAGITDPAGRHLGDDPTSSGWQTERIWLGDRYLAWYLPAWGNKTEFMRANAQGTTTMELQANNTVDTDIIFYPFEQVWSYGAWNELQFFAGMQDWDWTHGMGYTPSRTYRANHGRWLSPDPLAGQISNPQSLNRYAYALNNPTSATDPTGLDCHQFGTCAQQGSHPVSCTNLNCAWQYYSGTMPAFYKNPTGAAVMTCYQDGAPGSCGSISWTTVVHCPGNICGPMGAYNDPGRVAILEFHPTQTTASTYLQLTSWTYGGLTDQQYLAAYNAQLNAVVQALMNANADIGRVLTFVHDNQNPTDLSKLMLEGGNFDFFGT